MASTPELFKTRASEVFEIEDMNEPLLTVYQQFYLALRDNTDMLMLNSKELVHVSSGVVVKRLPMIYGSNSIYPSIKKNLFTIFERDDLVKQYFRLEQADDDNLAIKVVKPDDKLVW